MHIVLQEGKGYHFLFFLFITITEMTEYHTKRTIYIKSMALLSYLSLNDYLIL